MYNRRELVSSIKGRGLQIVTGLPMYEYYVFRQGGKRDHHEVMKFSHSFVSVQSQLSILYSTAYKPVETVAYYSIR